MAQPVLTVQLTHGSPLMTIAPVRPALLILEPMGLWDKLTTRAVRFSIHVLSNYAKVVNITA